jgi:hypothetical protein
LKPRTTRVPQEELREAERRAAENPTAEAWAQYQALRQSIAAGSDED